MRKNSKVKAAPKTSVKKAISDYTLAQRLLYLRQRRNFTQAELARQAGVSQSTIAQIESGRKDPSLSTVKKIADALDVHMAILFAADDVHVFDMKRLRTKYGHVDQLNETLYFAIGKVVAYARDIGYLK